MEPSRISQNAETTSAEREPAGRAFQRLSTELALARQELAEATERRAAEADGLQAEAAELEAEMARLATRLAAVRQELAMRPEQAAQAEQDGEQRCRPLERELEELKPRLGYNFDLPQDASLVIIGQLGLLRFRAARACRQLRAAVGSAQDLGLFRHRVLAVCTGGYKDLGHTVVCTGDAVLSFGCGGEGRLGYDAGIQDTPRVVTGLLDQEVVAAAASAFGTLVCTAHGQAYWFGALRDGPILSSALPQLVGGLQEVVGVAAGRDHLLAWTQSGQLYTWGVGEDGQLGHGSDDDEVAPRLVKGLVGQQVAGADAGGQHSVVCTASGRVYTFGAGEAWLGHGEDEAEDQLTPRLVEGLSGSRVVAVAAGALITAAVTEAGELYTWGAGDYGAQGHGEESVVEFLPRLVAGLAGKRVAGFATGDYHTLAWTDSGELYSWGCGNRGQLGHNSRENEQSPRRVEALAGKVVVGTAGGYSHSVVLTRDQKVYSFGNGMSGQLGHWQGQEIEDGLVPKEVGGLRAGAE